MPKLFLSLSFAIVLWNKLQVYGQAATLYCTKVLMKKLLLQKQTFFLFLGAEQSDGCGDAHRRIAGSTHPVINRHIESCKQTHADHKGGLQSPLIVLKPEDALALLQIGPVFTQTAVKSMKALEQLRWIGAQKVIDDSFYRDLVKKEESEYQEQFAAYMQKLSDPKV